MVLDKTLSCEQIILTRTIFDCTSYTMAKSGSNKPIDAPHQRRLPPLLRQAWYGLNQSFRRRIAHLNVTPDQFTLLRWLVESDAKGPTQRELTTMMASDANTIASLLSRMERDGFITRVPHESDKRANRVKLQASGKRVYQKARKIAIELQSEVLEILPASQRDKFLKQLEIVAEACRDSLSEE
jgi:DNA-binding MarR family transcriptional regulator